MPVETATTRALPLYVVADQSASMGGGPIADLNDTFAGLPGALARTPLLREAVHLSVIGFSDTATTHLPLTAVSDDPVVPRLSAASGTRFGAAFAELRDRIVADVVALRSTGVAVCRPAVLFVTDGGPLDPGWEATLDAVRALQAAPLIAAAGIGEHDHADLVRIASRPEWALDRGAIGSARVLEVLGRVLAEALADLLDDAADHPPVAIPDPTLDVACVPGTDDDVV